MCRTDNFYLTKQQLRDESPSRSAGVAVETETQLRAFGCDRIQRGVLYLRLPQAVAATGQVLLHRFYCKKSLTEFDVKVSTDEPPPLSNLALPIKRHCLLENFCLEAPLCSTPGPCLTCQYELELPLKLWI